MKTTTFFLRKSPNWLSLALALVILFVLFPAVHSIGQETIIYSEGFEANNGGYTKIIEPPDPEFPTLTGDGLWMWGVPSWVSAHTGNKCWGTNFDDNMPQSTSSIVSPVISLAALTSSQTARVSFWAAVDISMSGANGRFMVSSDGSNYTKLASFFINMAGGWQRYEFDISGYIGGNLYLKFYIVDEGYNRGFYVDDISISSFTKPATVKTLTLEANESSNGSCPWIYTWDGNEYKANNDIYSTARYVGGEYRDYLKLSKPLINTNGVYKLQINEVASDESFTDYVSLSAVDHAADIKVAPDNFGNIWAYKPANLIPPVSAITNFGVNVLDSISQEDEMGYNAYSQEYVDVDFGNVDISGGARMVMKIEGFLDGTGTPKPFIGPPAIVVQSFINGIWTEVGRMRPRFEWDVCAFNVLSFNLNPANGVKVRLYSISHGLKYTNIDFVALELGEEPAKTVTVAPFTAASFSGISRYSLLNAADNQYSHMLPGNHMEIEFGVPVQTAAVRSFIFTSEGYYIPRGSTYFIATWGGSEWIIHDGYSFATTDETKTFDLSLFLPDPQNEMKVRIWQDYAEGSGYPASIDFVGIQQGATVGTLSTATELTGNTSIKTEVQASDNIYWALHDQTYGRDRWIECKWTGITNNGVPIVSGINYTGGNIGWTYTDPEGDPQTMATVQVWTNPGGTGSLYWGPPTFTGTGTSVAYAGLPLVNGVTYYIRVKAFDFNNWNQWVEQSFTFTEISAPGVYTTAPTNVTISGATTGGEIFNGGGASVTDRGVCWSTSPNPTISDSHTHDGTGTGVFPSSITGLSGTVGMTIYIRAYGTNSAGTGYGPQMSFTYSAPIITTNNVTDISPTTATCGGYIMNDGNATVTARGVCWNTTGSPTTGDEITEDGTGAGGFISSITGLTLGTTYYVRAYATNDFGTAYGSEKTFVASINFCTPSPSSDACEYMYIANVSTTGASSNFSNPTGCAATSYTDFSSTIGATASIGTNVTMNFTISGYPMGVGVWIDFNDNGLFAASEYVISAASSMSPSGSFTIPAGTPSGAHKMRVRADYFGAPSDPCATLSYGETEDYSFTVASSGPTNPTSVTATVNPICNGGSTQLTASGVVGTVYWYTGSCGTSDSFASGSPITVNPTTTTTYYARNYSEGQYSAGCASLQVTVYDVVSANISGGSTPICYNTSPGTFTATGSGGTGTYTYLWYKDGSSTGITTQTYNPGALTTSSSFYCAVTSGSCGTANTGTTSITVYGALGANISGGTTPICYNTAPGTFTATGSGGTGTYTYLWYKNGSTTGITTQTYNPGALTTSSTFYCAVTSGSCGTVNTGTTSITVYGELGANISGGTSPICYNTSPGTFTATGSGGTGTYTYLWYKDGSSTGITTQTYNPGALTTLASFYCAVTSGSCGTVNTGTTSITVYGDLGANISGGTSPICYNTSPGTFTATGSNGTGSYTYLWYKDGSSTGVTTQTYNPGALTTSASFYCAVTSGSCGTVNTGTTSITVYGDLGANISGGTTPICYNTSPGTFTATGSNGTGSYTYLWYKDGSSTGITTQTYSPGALTASATFYCAVTSGSCGTVNTGTTSITVFPQFTIGSISADQTICYNSTPNMLNGVAPTGGNGPYTYQWQISEDDLTFNDIPDAIGINYQPGALTQTTYYRQRQISANGCGTLTTNTVTVTVFPTTQGGAVTGGMVVCYGTNSTLLTLSGHTGSVVKWQYTTNGTDWTDIDITSTTYTVNDLTVNTWFRAVVKSGVCPPENSAATQITMFTDYHVSGYAKYYNNPKTPLDQLKITLKKSGVIQGVPVVTSTNGFYDFGGLTNGTYEIEVSPAHPSGQWQTWNGVNNTDYLLVSRHATGVALLAVEPPVVRVTASVVAPHPAILTADANAVKNAAKYGWFMPGTSTPWFDIPKWVFSGTTTTNAITSFELNCNNLTRDIYGLCAGDVNGSYVPPCGWKQAPANMEIVNRGQIALSPEIIFPVRIQDDLEIGAITLMLDFDASLIEITGVEMPDQGDQAPWFIVNGNMLYLGWASLNPIRMIKDETLMLIHARVKDLQAEQIRFTLNSNPLSELADGEGQVIDGAKLAIADAGYSMLDIGEASVTVYPNPAKDVLNIEFMMTKDGLFTAELVNLQGVVLTRLNPTDAGSGWNKATVNLQNIVSGVYLLRVSCGEFKSTTKVVVNK